MTTSEVINEFVARLAATYKPERVVLFGSGQLTRSHVPGSIGPLADASLIVSFGVQTGDVVVFHPKTLHGGAATGPGQRRRTLTLRFFGDDACYDERVDLTGGRKTGFHAQLKTGDKFRDPSFLKLR